MITETELAYIAGIIDTMGNLRKRKVRAEYLPQVQVNGGKPEILDYLAGLTDTSVYPTFRDVQRRPCSQHCTENHVHAVSTSHRWDVAGLKATVVLYAVEPFLRVQGETARSLIDIGLASNYKGATAVKMAGLGWPIPELVGAVTEL